MRNSSSTRLPLSPASGSSRSAPRSPLSSSPAPPVSSSEVDALVLLQDNVIVGFYHGQVSPVHTYHPMARLADRSEGHAGGPRRGGSHEYYPKKKLEELYGPVPPPGSDRGTKDAYSLRVRRGFSLGVRHKPDVVRTFGPSDPRTGTNL